MSYTSAQWAISRLLKSGILEAKSGGRFLFNKNKLLISGQPIDHREVVNPLTKGGQPIDQSGQPIDHSNIYKEERKPKESERKGTAHVFRKPSLAELSEHLKQVKSTINPERFLAYYDSKGWKVGNSPMKDWKAAVRTWDLKERAQQEEKLTPEQIEARANKRAGVGQ
jgi:hypothetical protein